MLKILRSIESTTRLGKGGVRVGGDSGGNGGNDSDYDNKHSSQYSKQMY